MSHRSARAVTAMLWLGPLLGLGGGWSRLVAQDPTVLYPANYHVLVENDRVRVMDFRLRKGATEALHQHPAHVLYVLEPLEIEFSFPDGKTGKRVAKPGDVLFSEAVTHSPRNVGAADAHGILIELKNPDSKSTGPAVRPATADYLTALTYIKGAPGREQELVRELSALSAPTRAEPGNFAYDLYQSLVKPNEFVRFEVWQDDSALAAHKRTPHLQASFQRRQEQGWTTEITLWKRIEP